MPGGNALAKPTSAEWDGRFCWLTKPAHETAASTAATPARSSHHRQRRESSPDLALISAKRCCDSRAAAPAIPPIRFGKGD